MEDDSDILSKSTREKINGNSEAEKFTINSTDIIDEVEKLKALSNQATQSENLKTMLATREKLRELKGTDIKFAQPVLKQGDNAVIFPHTSMLFRAKLVYTKVA